MRRSRTRPQHSALDHLKIIRASGEGPGPGPVCVTASRVLIQNRPPEAARRRNPVPPCASASHGQPRLAAASRGQSAGALRLAGAWGLGLDLHMRMAARAARVFRHRDHRDLAAGISRRLPARGPASRAPGGVRRRRARPREASGCRSARRHRTRSPPPRGTGGACRAPASQKGAYRRYRPASAWASRALPAAPSWWGSSCGPGTQRPGGNLSHF